MKNTNLQADGSSTVDMPPMDADSNIDVSQQGMDGGTVPPANALSIYGQDAGVEDFPVLKAFQQYIDAEQSKSRKRMIMLSMFFGVLMTILVAVFVFLLGQMNRDKQSANDRLVEFLMREREAALRGAPGTVQHPVAAQTANSANDAALKAMTDTLTALQRQMADDRAAAAQRERDAEHKKELEAARAAAQNAASIPEHTEKSAAQKELERINREKIEKIKKANAIIQAERRKLAAEKERLRQEKIEEYRRKHYPELYRPRQGEPSEVKRSLVSRRSAIASAIVTDQLPPAAKNSPSKSNEKKESEENPPTESELVTPDDQPIEYFSTDDGEYKMNDLGVEIGM